MPVTAIRHVINETNKLVNIENRETTRDTAGNRGTVGVKAEKQLELWIPWCTREADFEHHHLDVFVEGKDQPYSIWQAELGGADRVRVSPDGSWQSPGGEIGGLAGVGGNRTLRIQEDGLLLEQYVGVAGDPPAWPTAGTSYLALWRPEPDWGGVDPIYDPSRPDIFIFDGQANPSRPGDVNMGRVTNTAVLNDGRTGLTIRLWHDGSGQTVDLGPGQTTDAFAGTAIGFFASVDWHGRAMNVSNVLLKKPLELEYTWVAADVATPTPLILIERVDVDPPGADVQSDSGEFVELAATGGQTVEVGGWYLVDDAGVRIDIPADHLVTPNRPLRVYTGPGAGTPSKVYAGRHRAVWTNNPGDTARLYDSNDEPVYEFRYRR
jgi:hypothetical protein